MNVHLQAVKIDPSRALGRQIRDQVRELILTGKLVPGERMPTSTELTRIFATDVFTIHTALAPLAKEGLIERIQKRGTFVRRREERLTCIGIYYPEDAFGRSLYLQSLHAALKRELQARDIETDVWLDPRPFEKRDTAWAPFARAAEHREFQAMIVPVSDRPRLRWLRKLPVPASFQTSEAMPMAVNTDLNQFADLALQALAQQGCRSVGLIAPLATSTPQAPQPFDVFFAHFIDVSRNLGLAIKNPWMLVARHENDLCGRSHESFGYERLLALWRQPVRPDGLVVSDDVTARGVITALLEKSVRVPAELKLVLHKNEDIELLCPMPATFLVRSERATARALITQVEKQFRGEHCEPIVLGYRLAAGARGKQQNPTTNGRSQL